MLFSSRPLSSLIIRLTCWLQSVISANEMLWSVTYHPVSWDLKIGGPEVRSSKLCQITTLKSANPYPDIWCPQRFHKVTVTIHFYHKSRLAILKMSNQLWVNCLFKSLQLIQITPLRILFASICILIYDGLFSSAYLIIYMSTLHRTKCAFILSWCWIINKTSAEHHDNSEMSPKGIWFMN